MKKIALFESTGKPEVHKWVEVAVQKLRLLDVKLFASQEMISNLSQELHDYIVPKQIEEFEKVADFVISFGGDGTMLAAARSLINSGLPIMGVNVGRLGFLAEFAVDHLEQSLDNLLESNYRVVERAVFETVINGEKIFALNDFVIEKKDSSRMITVQAYANDNYIGDYRADGLIITSPTGSSAYSLSCGGPIISPNSPVLCLTPISPHTLTLRPLVIPDTNEILLKVHSPNGHANLVADGQIERTLNNDDAVVIRKSENSIKLIKPTDKSFFQLLREKFLWATHVPDNDQVSNEN